MARILIADDDRLVINQIKEALRRFGHTFITTQDGKTAKQRLKKELFDLALIESNLPPIKGLDLVNEQKMLHVEDRVPIVLMATQHEAEDMRKAKEAGALDFITKPFNSRELVGKVLAILKQETRIVSLGGGTGLYTLLMGLKTLSRVHLVSVVSMSDDGGSTGRLREAFGILPPGDIRRSLVALSTAPDLLNHLLAYRFKKGGEELAGHNFGNLFLTALSDVGGGSMQEAVRSASEILNIKGVVLPVTNTFNQLIAETEDGAKVYGESSIDVPEHRDYKLNIKNIWQEPAAYAIPEAISVIHNSEFITLGPGDLFTSLIPNLIVKGIPEAIRESEAKKIYISNLMTKPGETYGMKGEDHVEQVLKYLGGDFLDYIVFSKTPIPKKMVTAYKKKQQDPVRLANRKKLKKITKAKIIEADITSTEDHVRHDSYKLAKVVNDILAAEKRPKAGRRNHRRSKKR